MRIPTTVHRSTNWAIEGVTCTRSQLPTIILPTQHNYAVQSAIRAEHFCSLLRWVEFYSTWLAQFMWYNRSFSIYMVIFQSNTNIYLPSYQLWKAPLNKRHVKAALHLCEGAPAGSARARRCDHLAFQGCGLFATNTKLIHATLVQLINEDLVNDWP